MSVLSLLAIIGQFAHLTFLSILLLAEVFCGELEILSFISLDLVELALKFLELLCLVLDNLGLRVEHKLLALDLKRLLVQLVERPIEVSLHLCILRLEQTQVLVARLVVVVQAANARLLLVLEHLLFQDFQLELHEVDLLLKVHDVIVFFVSHIRIVAQLAGRLLPFVLTSEVHCHGGAIACVVAEGPPASKIGATFQITAS